MNLNQKNLYEYLGKKDLITKLRPLLKNNEFHVRPDGKVERIVNGTAWDTPWVHSYPDNYNDCGLWHRIAFPLFKFVPSFCTECWKVVVRLNTLEELFKLYEIQQEYERPCKCGIEIREFVHGNYGGYFYNRGKENGLECYKWVRQEVDKHIGKDTSVILKCACSEYEMELGPPDDWEVTDDQKEIEDLLKQWVVIPNLIFHQPDYLKAHVMKKWIHLAYSVGDKTYSLYTEGEKLFKDVKTYHHEVNFKNGCQI